VVTGYAGLGGTSSPPADGDFVFRDVTALRDTQPTLFDHFATLARDLAAFSVKIEFDDHADEFLGRGGLFSFYHGIIFHSMDSASPSVFISGSGSGI
jgi:hypothetical protein